MLSFRWKYIALPLVFLLLSITVIVYFYPRLPEDLAYRFNDSQPDRWLNRTTAIAWLLVPQFLLIGLGAAITVIIIRLSRRMAPASGKRAGTTLLLMGNMVALPQLVLIFAMLTIFSYNSYGVYLMPVWAFALLIMGIGGIILGAFFFFALKQALAKK